MNLSGPTRPTTTWDKRFLEQALLIASWSKDRSTQVGCVIVGPDREIRSTGYNGFPRGVNDNLEERYQKPVKYLYTEHAERNAIYNAARMGTSLKGCTIYLDSTPSKLPYCADCARAIIQSGIVRVVHEPGLDDERWRESGDISSKMFLEAGVVHDIVSI